MKTFKLTLIFFILSLCFAQTIKAQSEYVVTLQNDTIKGEVKNYFDYLVKFIPEGGSEKVKYSTNEIKSFHVEKTRKYPTDCEAVKLPDKKNILFAHRVISGKITLYELIETSVSYDGRSSSSVTWYVKKQGQEIIAIKTSRISFSRKERDEALFALLKDKPEVANRYQNEDKFSFDFIRSIITD
ncbi:hypothetical protein [Pedobacter frigidisoli]|uniref:hypothetical protein n=1 Tax=Pedobacter frigidisoli TaxID=2530455 RepID=UPI00292EC80E|nr:hypothetical protein [Pedobacter frigidisoli]